MNAYNETTGCIHGDFNPLGTRTHRCVHSKPNMGNISSKKTIKYNSKELRDLATNLGGRMRSMWGLSGSDLSDENVWLDTWILNYCSTKENITLSIIKSGLKPGAKTKLTTGVLKEIDNLNPVMALLAKTTIECLKNKKVSVFCVKETGPNLLSIIVTPPKESGDCCVDSAIHNLVGMKIEGNSLQLISKERNKDSQWLCGTDMESAHLRIFAHLINDKDFIQALISGKKEDGTDPHTLNKRRLGDICVDRDRAKTFIFTFLNGGTANRVRHIFGCSASAAREGISSFVRSYPGLARLRETTIPADAARGFFQGVDGRLVVNDSEHLMIGMYLQNMESVLMKHACEMWKGILDRCGIRYKIINWVHDEFVTIVYGTKETAELVGRIQSWSITKVGKLFKLNCPIGGESKVGTNWLEVH